jgi:hypothetical protein
VILVIGCEFMLFTPGIVPGKDFYERVAYLTKGYSYHQDPAEHSKELAPFRKWSKPILILEFGCCTFTGAPEVGGMGWGHRRTTSSHRDHRTWPIPGTTWTSLRSACAR